ncbi:hypothetical protein PF004_g27963 [Phytophthora fragariae]|nr:hypothetical protein PF011_g29484 [Phytophthora fragariae]KAE9170171.1 hypothetical protein PF004_g27963 [Phytophthora fragariae]
MNAATLKTNVTQRTRTEVPKADTTQGVRSERQPVSKKPDRKPTPPKKSQRNPSSLGVDISDATKVGGTLLTLRPYFSSG